MKQLKEDGKISVSSEATMKKLWTFVLLALLFAVAAARDDWCSEHDHEDEDDDHSHEEETAEPEEFLMELFDLYGRNSTCTISEHKFEKLLEDLGIGQESDDDHDHERRRKREVDHTCYTAEELLDIYNVSHDDGVTQDQFSSLAAALIQQIVQGCVDDHKDKDKHKSNPAAYGYGTVAVIIITLCAPLGLLIVRFEKSSYYKYIMATLLGLAVGALSGDALIHLIPHSALQIVFTARANHTGMYVALAMCYVHDQGLGLHDHEEDEHDHESEGIQVEAFVWKTAAACLAIWLFFNLQLLLTKFTTQKSGKVGENQEHDVSEGTGENAKSDPESTLTRKGSGKLGASDEQDVVEETSSQKGIIDDVKADTSLGWMVVCGDALHNFVDGLAIGAAFTASWQAGISTSIAVFIHELAHEFGDCAVLLSVGWSWKFVLVMQLISQLPAFLGLYIGVPVAESSVDAQQWILCIAAGMFLYIALCDIVPELVQYTKSYDFRKMLICINIGLFIGYITMLIIGVFEEEIDV